MEISFTTSILTIFSFLLIGIISSYSDVRYSKIFNKTIIFSFVYLFFFYFFLFFFENNVSLFNLIINGTISFFLGYFFWYFGLWSAGDAKLFSVYAFLIPTELYSDYRFFPFFSFLFLINLFIPIILFALIKALFYLIKKIQYKKIFSGKSTIKSVFNYSVKIFQVFLNYLFALIFLRAIFLVFSEKIMDINFFENPYFIFLFLILVLGSFHKIRNKNKKINLLFYSTILGYALFFIYYGKIFQLLQTMKTAFFFMIFIGLLRKTLLYYASIKEIRRIKIEEVKEGIIFSEKEKESFLKKIIKYTGKIDAGGINKRQAEIIKIFLKKEKRNDIETEKTIPFAPLLFSSIILSFLIKDGILLFIDKLLLSWL